MRVTLPLLVLPLLAGCSHPTALQPPRNPAGFPLYPGSTILVARAWKHALTPAERSAFGIVDARGAAYAGHEVVTATQARFSSELAWLRAFDASPPRGYRIGIWGSGVDQAREQARSAGLDFTVFQRNERSGAHDVLVMVVDPALLQRKAGLMLTAMEHFRSLPDFLKAPIDAQARAQTGFTVSEALDPMTPIGAAIDALGRLNASGARGVIYVDAEPAR